MNPVIDFLLTNYPIAIWLILGGAVAWLYLSVKNTSKKARDNAAEAHVKISSLPCDNQMQELSRQKDLYRDLDLKTDKFILELNAMAKDIRNIFLRLDNKAIIPPYTKEMSPVMITERGMERIRELGIDRMIAAKWASISSYIGERTASKNPYDIQQICIDEMLLNTDRFLTEAEIDRLKVAAYNEGAIIQVYLRIIALYIRDRYFEEQHISWGDIDRHAPPVPTSDIV
ncbi:MAG: hypothetical protein LBF90_04380 [Prevotellaceae bacterium]|jgi:hypothetical protein|nr:hypothetical protein [Prevotellaceae bacterium]